MTFVFSAALWVFVKYFTPVLTLENVATLMKTVNKEFVFFMPTLPVDFKYCNYYNENIFF